MLSSTEEKIVILDRSYCIENNGFRNVLIILLVADGKFERCSSVPAKWQTEQFIHIYIYIGRYFSYLTDKHLPKPLPALLPMPRVGEV